MNKNQLIDALKNIKGNPEVLIYCSHNTFDVRHIINCGDKIVLPVGNTNNDTEMNQK